MTKLWNKQLKVVPVLCLTFLLCLISCLCFRVYHVMIAPFIASVAEPDVTASHVMLLSDESIT